MVAGVSLGSLTGDPTQGSWGGVGVCLKSMRGHCW